MCPPKKVGLSDAHGIQDFYDNSGFIVEGVAEGLVAKNVEAVFMKTQTWTRVGSDVAVDQERRLSWRARAPYPARLWATDTAGRVWREDVVLDNISGGGLYVRLNRSLEKNAKLSVVVSLATAPKTSPALRLAARAVVLRVERQPDGTCGVALQFGRRRVL